MQIGISTASLFGRKFTEEALEFLANNNVPCAEVFLGSFCEYNNEFGKKLSQVKGNLNVHSFHILTTQVEPQLYSANPRAMEDSFKILENALSCAKEIGAKYYTFHGGARFKKLPFKMNYAHVGKVTQRIIDCAKAYDIDVAQENVHWGYYNYIGFFEELRKRTKGLKATLDIKQALLSGLTYQDYIKEMKEDIVTVHLLDVDEQGNMCLPGKGKLDFYEMFSMLKDVGFDGAILIEAYKDNFRDYQELFASLSFLKEMAYRVF